MSIPYCSEGYSNRGYCLLLTPIRVFDELDIEFKYKVKLE